MKLIGYIDGIEVKFDFYPPNVFRGVVPKHINGKYLIELKAIDDAGNYDFKTNMLVCIDFQKMSFKVLENKFHFNTKQELDYKVISSSYSYRELVI